MSLLQKVRESQKQAEIDRQKIEPDDVNLRGTGLTKREAEKVTKEYERETEKSLRSAESPSLVKNEAEEKFARAIEETARAMEDATSRGEIELDASQIAAVRGIKENQFSVLIGAAGTGKTTVTKRIVEELSKRVKVINYAETYFETIQGPDDKPMRVRASPKGEENEADLIPSIAGAAYTGRASQQFRRAMPEKYHRTISTIHSMLGYAPVYEDYEDFDPISKIEVTKTRRVFRPSFDEMNKLPFTVFIFDEASMIPIPLWNEFIAATNPNVRIVLIGDINQLPPAYGKGILGYAMRHWPVFELTQIHRQAANNAIIRNAHNVLNGKPLENASNFHMIGNSGEKKAPAGQGEMKVYVLNVIRKLHELGRYDPYRDTIIVPQNKGMIGQLELNSHLVTMFNPERRENGIIVNKRVNIHTGKQHVYFAMGDKVMIIANINNTEPPITNGMVGIVESINVNGKYDMKRAQVDFSENDDADDDDPLEIDLDMSAINFALEGEETGDGKKEKEAEDQRQSSHVMTIKFDNGQSFVCSTAGDYSKVVFGYATTCHKAQGGEYANIIVVCHSANSVMLKREWLYTALTRAKQNVYLICNARGLQQAITNQSIKGRTIAEKIRSYLIETKSDDTEEFDTNKFPILWANKHMEDMEIVEEENVE